MFITGSESIGQLKQKYECVPCLQSRSVAWMRRVPKFIDDVLVQIYIRGKIFT